MFEKQVINIKFNVVDKIFVIYVVRHFMVLWRKFFRR